MTLLFSCYVVSDSFVTPLDHSPSGSSLLGISPARIVEVKVAHLCDPVDYTVHGILQARIVEWVAFLFSRGSSQPKD